jgi:hypothetical protein
MARLVTFLSDYGWEDDFVGVCHGVVARLGGGAVLDLAHGVPRHDVRAGALILRRALPFCPPGVHLAVVDPGVGTARRAVALALREEGRVLVGPDNGLLALAAEHFGGVVEAVELSRSRHRLEPVSATFHGRDLFAPVAARLAQGEPLPAVGEPLDPARLTDLALPRPWMDHGELVAHAVSFDAFGNVGLEAEAAALLASSLAPEGPVLVAGRLALYGRTFADVAPGELLLYEDAYRSLAVAVNRGSARAELGLGLDDEVRIALA